MVICRPNSVALKCLASCTSVRDFLFRLTRRLADALEQLSKGVTTEKMDNPASTHTEETTNKVGFTALLHRQLW